MPDSDRRWPLPPIRSLLSGGARRARSVIRPARGSPELGEVGSAGSLLQESFVRQLERLNLLTRGLAPQGIAGEHRSRRHAGSAEFSDYRRYTPGDDFRRIDWNAYARLDGLFLKLTEAKVEVPVHLLLDCSRSMNWGSPNKLGFARRLAAAIGYLALARFDAVAGASFSDQLYERFPLVRGKAQAMRLLACLDRAPVGEVTRLQLAVSQYCDSSADGGIAFLISDLLTEDDWQAGVLQLLRQDLDVVVIHVLAPQELHPTLDGEVELLDAETGEIVELVVGEDARQTYAARADAWCAEVQDFCRRSEVGHLRLETTAKLEEIFLNQMRHRRIVR
jgi:uncharacterized protein (DUF58 family)